MYGRANALAPTAPKAPPNTERRLSLAKAALPSLLADRSSAGTLS